MRLERAASTSRPTAWAQPAFRPRTASLSRAPTTATRPTPLRHHPSPRRRCENSSSSGPHLQDEVKAQWHREPFPISTKPLASVLPAELNFLPVLVPCLAICCSLCFPYFFSCKFLHILKSSPNVSCPMKPSPRCSHCS